jgi:hypothetical protein
MQTVDGGVANARSFTGAWHNYGSTDETAFLPLSVLSRPMYSSLPLSVRLCMLHIGL